MMMKRSRLEMLGDVSRLPLLLEAKLNGRRRSFVLDVLEDDDDWDDMDETDDCEDHDDDDDEEGDEDAP